MIWFAKYVLRFSKYYGAIIGSKGHKKQSIETDTQTTITIPGRGHEEIVEVLGSSRSSVSLARCRIEKIVSEHKPKFTHFLSVPITNEFIIEKFVEFKVTI